MTGPAFLAVDLSIEERHALSAALRDAGPGSPVPGKRQPAENWHITLRFLGECSDVDADSVLRELDETLDAEPGRVACSGIGAFPRPSKAGIVFVRVEDTDGLLAGLAAQGEAAARDVGFEPEERPFVGHLTLSRLRPPQDVRRLIDTFEDFRVPIEVSAITLFRTRRSNSGLWYEPIDTIEIAYPGS